VVAAATANGQTPAPYPLGEVVVSAERPVSEAAATVRTVTREDILAYGARTLDEALALLPGVEVRTGGAGVPRVNVRGFRGRHLVLLLDGIPLNSTFDGQADPSLVPVEQIAAIKLTPGTGSVLYEQGGLGGVINIVTRRGQRGIAGEAGVEARESAARLARGSVSGGTDDVDVFVSASTFDSDGFPSVVGAPSLGPSSEQLRPNSDRRRTNLFGNVLARPTERLQLGLVLSGVHAEYGLPPNTITDPDDVFANRPVFERVEDTDGISAHLAGSYTPAGLLSVRSWAFINGLDERRNRYDDDTYSSMDDETVRGTFRGRTKTRLTGGAVQIATTRGRLGRLTLGVSAERDAWDLDLVIRDVQRSGGGGGGGNRRFDVRSVTDERSLRRYAIALEHQVSFTERAGVFVGYAHHWLDKDDDGQDDAGAASVGAYVDVAAGTRLRAAAARTIRFPTIRQLYDADGGNVALRSERATIVEAGVEQTLPARTLLTLTLFRTTVRDFIERPNQGEPFANHDEYLFAGAEVTAESRVVRDILLRARYTYLDTEDRSPGSVREALQYRPRHRGSVEARYALTVGLSASISVLYVADQVFYSRQEPITSARLPDYTLANTRVEQTLFRGAASVYLGVDNLFDERYEEEYGSPQATRVVYGGLSVRWR
jgi:outer membrane cobalamin receptor